MFADFPFQPRSRSLDRLPPGSRAPASSRVDDAMKSYHWILAQGISAKQTVLMGDSAGGGLTVAMMVAVRDRGNESACCGRLPLPMDRPRMHRRAAEDRRSTNNQKRPPRARPTVPWWQGSAPRRYMPTSPGCHRCTSSQARLRSCSTTRIASPNVPGAGVEVTLETWDGLFHVFQLIWSCPSPGKAVEKIGAFVRSRTA